MLATFPRRCSVGERGERNTHTHRERERERENVRKRKGETKAGGEIRGERAKSGWGAQTHRRNRCFTCGDSTASAPPRCTRGAFESTSSATRKTYAWPGSMPWTFATTVCAPTSEISNSARSTRSDEVPCDRHSLHSDREHALGHTHSALSVAQSDGQVHPTISVSTACEPAHPWLG